MQKRLNVLGNSLALVIDKSLRRVLGIGRDTILQVSTDGRRILIEPTGELHVPTVTATEIDAPRVFDTLMRRFNMSKVQFDLLAAVPIRIMAYRGGLGLPCDEPAHRVTMERLAACLRHLLAKATWDDAVRATLEEVPYPPASTQERSTERPANRASSPS